MTGWWIEYLTHGLHEYLLTEQLNFKKCTRMRMICTFLTSKCTSRDISVQFFDIKKWSETVSFFSFWLGNVFRTTTACIRTLKSAPELTCFLHFELEMCFPPQWCATLHTNHWKKHSISHLLFHFAGLCSESFKLSVNGFWYFKFFFCGYISFKEQIIFLFLFLKQKQIYFL